jgi:fumarate hydratase subunit beta
MKNIQLPLTKDIVKDLRLGQEVLLSGGIYTARDQAHKRIYESIINKKRPPICLKNNIIYYCGPTPARPDQIIGACGPTTSKRMDSFTPALLAAGLAATIGKGKRSKEVIDAIARYRAVYFITIGGAGAYLSTKIKSSRVVAYEELGPEAVYELTVEDFPVIVAIDSRGGNIYK